MKRVNNIWREKITFTNLYRAHLRARRGKRFKAKVIKFSLNLEENIENIGKSLLRNDYKFGEYKEFSVFEPKERKIKVLPYRDRVVHQFYVEEYIKPIFVKDFVKDSYASIKGRGVHQAVLALKKYMMKMKREYNEYYILKCDIKSFFASVNHEILYEIIKSRVKDKEFLKFTRGIIFCDDTGVGIPIGNYTSQYFANIYLNRLDKFIKEKLRVKYYVRYMDDFVLLFKSSRECIFAKEEIIKFLGSLKLTLNPKTTYIKSDFGVNFCGYKVFDDKIILRPKNKTRLKRWLKKIMKLYGNDAISLEAVNRKMPSIKGHLTHCRYFKLYESIIKEFVLIKKDY